MLVLRQIYPGKERLILGEFSRLCFAWLGRQRRRGNALGPVRKPAPAPRKGAALSVQPPSRIRIIDPYGRQIEFTRNQWRTQVLPGHVKEAWNDPEELYLVIADSIRHGFCQEMMAAGRQLYRIDPDRKRATGVYSSLLIEGKRVEKAEKVLRHYLGKHGRDALVLVNLAKVYACRKNGLKTCELLSLALELDPNLEIGLSWYLAIHHERGGPPAALDACLRMTRLPGSWRARLYLARTALQTGDLERALALYDESLERAGTPVPADLLLQMSGDLAQFAHLPELLNLILPRFDPLQHGVQVGARIVQAYIDLGQIESASKLVDQLYGFKRSIWRPTLSAMEQEIAKAKVAATTTDSASSMELLRMGGILWLDPNSQAAELFPAKLQEGPEICFLGFTGSDPTTDAGMGGKRQLRNSNDLGHLSRMLPLFLAEQIELKTDARATFLVPWMLGEAAGFVFSGRAWPEEQVPELAGKADYAVICHWKSTETPWQVELSIIRTIDGERLEKMTREYHQEKAGEAFQALSEALLKGLEEHAALQAREAPAHYQIPCEKYFIAFLRRVEHLLSVRCGLVTGGKPDFLEGEREVIDGAIHLCVADPLSVPARIVLAQLLLNIKKVRPGILNEYSEKVTLLQREFPLKEPAQSVLQSMFDIIYPLEAEF